MGEAVDAVARTVIGMVFAAIIAGISAFVMGFIGFRLEAVIAAVLIFIILSVIFVTKLGK